MDNEVALQVKTPTPPSVPVFDAATPLADAQKLESNQTALQAGQTQLQMQNRQNAGEDIQFRSQLIRDAASHALDADSWDAAMRNAAAKGAPEAQQYIGRYTPLLQQRLFDAYAGQPPQGSAGAASAAGGAAASPTDTLDRMYQNVSPAQMAQSLQKNNAILGVLATIKDQPSQDAAVARLSAMGIPAQQFFGQTYNPLQVVKLWNDTQQRAGYLQNRVAAATTGAPNPLVKNDVQSIDGVGYSVDPYKNTATALTPAKPVKIGSDLGNDIYGVPDQNSPNGYRVVDPSQMGTGGGVSIAEAVRRFQPTENATGNPAAANPRSTSMGNSGFIDKTWLDTIKTARPDLAKSFNDQQLLALRAVPEIDSAMATVLAKENAGGLAKAGLPVTTATVAIAHHFGIGDATKILNAPSDTPLEKVLSPGVMTANPDLKGQTAGAYAQTLAKRVGNDAISDVGPGASGTTASTLAGGGLGKQGFDASKLPEGVDPKTGIDPQTGRNEGFLLTRPAEDRGLIKGLANYDIDPNSVGYRQKAAVQAALATYDPTYRSDVFPIVKSTEEAFTKGKQGDQVRFFNNSIQHMTTLQKYADAMQNGDTRAINSLKNAFQTQLGVAAPNTFDALKDVVGQEIVKSIVPGGGGEAERQAVAQKLTGASSPAQISSLLDGYKELGGAQLRDLKVQYENGTFHKRNDFDDKLIPESRAALSKVGSSSTTGSTPAGQTANAPPVPGAKLFQGKWYTRGQNGEAIPVQ